MKYAKRYWILALSGVFSFHIKNPCTIPVQHCVCMIWSQQLLKIKTHQCRGKSDPIHSAIYSKHKILWYFDQPDNDLDEDLSASSPQLDSTRLPRTLTNELPRFNMAALRGAKWLNWTEDRQPMKPLDPACRTSSSTPARPDSNKETLRRIFNICPRN